MTWKPERNDFAPSYETIQVALAKVEMALNLGNHEQAYAAIDAAFKSLEPEEPVTLESSIAMLGLPERISGALERADILTVRTLTRKCAADVCRLWNLGDNAVDQVRTALARYGFSLRGKSMLELDQA